MFDVFGLITVLKKHIQKTDILLAVVAIISYFITRLINLTKFPIFTDEGIYIHWAKIAWHDASWRFISLTDGKQPLQTWGTIPFLKLFPQDALLAGRLFSVATGFVALIGMFAFLYYLFGKKTAWIGTFVYLFTPFFLFYDRLALTDSAVNAFFILTLLFSIMLARTIRLDVALIFGIVAGLSLLTKSSARIFLALSALAPMLFFQKNLKKLIQNSINYFILFAAASFLALVMYNIQRLSPFFHYIAEKNKTFVMTFAEFRADPFASFFGNLKLIPYYVAAEMGYILAALGLLGLILLWQKQKRLFFYLFVWIIVPYLALSFFSKVVFPRYLIFFASLFTISASYFLSNLKNKQTFYVSVILVTVSFVIFDLAILYKPKSIPLPPVDRGQYIEGVTAGWGVGEIVGFAREKSKEKPVILVAEGNFGLIADMLDVFLRPGDNVSIKGYWPLGEKELLENQPLIEENKVYVVFSHRSEFPQGWPIKFVKKYEKPNNKSAYYLYELTY